MMGIETKRTPSRCEEEPARMPAAVSGGGSETKNTKFFGEEDSHHPLDI